VRPRTHAHTHTRTPPGAAEKTFDLSPESEKTGNPQKKAKRFQVKRIYIERDIEASLSFFENFGVNREKETAKRFRYPSESGFFKESSDAK